MVGHHRRLVGPGPARPALGYATALYSKANYERELQLTQVSENVLYQCLSVYLAGMLHILVLCALLVVSASFIVKHMNIVLFVNDVS